MPTCNGKTFLPKSKINFERSTNPLPENEINYVRKWKTSILTISTSIKLMTFRKVSCLTINSSGPTRSISFPNIGSLKSGNH